MSVGWSFLNRGSGGSAIGRGNNNVTRNFTPSLSGAQNYRFGELSGVSKPTTNRVNDPLGPDDYTAPPPPGTGTGTGTGTDNGAWALAQMERQRKSEAERLYRYYTPRFQEAAARGNDAWKKLSSGNYGWDDAFEIDRGVRRAAPILETLMAELQATFGRGAGNADIGDYIDMKGVSDYLNYDPSMTSTLGGVFSRLTPLNQEFEMDFTDVLNNDGMYDNIYSGAGTGRMTWDAENQRWLNAEGVPLYGGGAAGYGGQVAPSGIRGSVNMLSFDERAGELSVRNPYTGKVFRLSGDNLENDSVRQYLQLLAHSGQHGLGGSGKQTMQDLEDQFAKFISK